MLVLFVICLVKNVFFNFGRLYCCLLFCLFGGNDFGCFVEIGWVLYGFECCSNELKGIGIREDFCFFMVVVWVVCLLLFCGCCVLIVLDNVFIVGYVINFVVGFFLCFCEILIWFIFLVK